MGRKIVLTFFLTIILVGMSSAIFKVGKVRASGTIHSRVDAATTLHSDMPVVFVDPQNKTADPGDTITISVKFYNLTGRFYMGADSPPGAPQWEAGEPLPPPGSRFNYSLGNLYAFEVGFSWDPSLLEYQSHIVKVPVETYPDGVLFEPVIDVEEHLDTDHGTYLVAKTSFLPAEPFCTGLGGNATVFDMTFRVKKFGKCNLNITSSDLAIGLVLDGFEDCFAQIPHWTANSIFQTETLVTRLESIETGGYDNNTNTFFNPPVISGEDAMVKIAVVNDGSITDTYNLTLSSSGSLLKEWRNETLEPGEQKTFNYTIDEAELSIGNYSTTANISVLHHGFILTDGIIKQFRVIGTPQLSIIGPNTGRLGDTVSYTSLGNHTDPYGEIWNYRWALWAPGETYPRMTIMGENATFNLYYKWTGGDWTIKLAVKDNYGVEYDEDRPSTEPYQIEHPLFLLTTIIIEHVSPTSGSPGTHVYIRGGRASGEVMIYFDGKSVSNVTERDWWTTYFEVPDVPPGEYTITALDVATNTTDTAIFTVITPPTLTISPPEAPMGSKILIFGEGFTSGMSLFITFEDLISFSSIFSMITVGENGTFNTTMILPVVNSGNYTIKAIGSSFYFPYQTSATVSFRVTKGLDTLFEELEALREAINQTGCSDPCEEDDLSNTNETSATGEESSNESAQANVDTDSSYVEELALREGLESAEYMAFEARIFALVAIIIAIVASVLAVVILLKRS